VYKVPGRLIHCDTIGSWIREIIWCYVIMKLFKDDIDAISRSYLKQERIMLDSIIKGFNARSDKEFENYD
jgi:hypothetical protein